MSLVELKDKEPKCSSEVMAKELGISHQAVIKLLDKNQDCFPSSGFEILLGKRGARPKRVYWFTEELASLFIMFTKPSEKTKPLKIMLNKQFHAMRKTLMDIANNKKNLEWIAMRDSGKLIHKDRNDAAKEYIEYAIAQGSETYKNKPELFYINLNKAEYKALYIYDKNIKEIRDKLDRHQLGDLRTADNILMKVMRTEMEKGTHYKDIFKICKEKLNAFVDVIGPSIISLLENKD